MSKILAIDLGKNNSAVCIFDRGSLKCKYKTYTPTQSLDKNSCFLR